MSHDLIPNDDSVLTVAETARLLSVSKFTLLRMRQREGCGGLPFVQLSPGRIGYLRRDVRGFLVARRVGSLVRTKDELFLLTPRVGSPNVEAGENGPCADCYLDHQEGSSI